MKNFPTDSSNSKSKIDKSDIGKSETSPIDLKMKNDVIKKDAYNAKIKNIEDKIADNTNLTTKITLNYSLF